MLIKNVLSIANLRLLIYVSTLKSKKTHYFIEMIRSTRLILEFINENLYSLLKNMFINEM